MTTDADPGGGREGADRRIPADHRRERLCRRAIAVSGLRELGLPYESEPAITTLAHFSRSVSAHGGGMARPDAVLFNGGFFTPANARTRVLDALESWFGARPMELENESAGSRRGHRRRVLRAASPRSSRGARLLIRAGSARGVLRRRSDAECRGRRAGSRLRDAERHARGHELRRSIASSRL